MSGPYPLATLSAQITSTGISAPTYDDIFASLQASYQAIYGSDIYIDPDSQDGQFLAIFAKAINDNNALAIAVYNAFSPATAQGIGLSRMVKINGIQRLVPTNSMVDVTIVGDPGTTITNGNIQDKNGNIWLLPASVVIPSPQDQIDVTAICATPGAVTAPAGTINIIATPTRGWDSVTNALDAIPGNPLESDATLRRRQSVSTALPALSVLDAIIGQVANLPGVVALRGYENDTGVPDINGIPAHTVCMVVKGGDPIQIAHVIALTKTPGTGTFGTTREVIIDPEGVPNFIKFQRPIEKRLSATVYITAGANYLSNTGSLIQQQLSDYVTSVGIGNNVPWWRLFGASDVPVLDQSYDVTNITIGVAGGVQSNTDVPVLFNEEPQLAVGDITLVAV